MPRMHKFPGVTGARYITIPGLPRTWFFTQEEIDLIKAYEPKKLYLRAVEGECVYDKTGDYLILTGSMLEAAEDHIIFNYKTNPNNPNNKENN